MDQMKVSRVSGWCSAVLWNSCVRILLSFSPAAAGAPDSESDSDVLSLCLNFSLQHSKRGLGDGREKEEDTRFTTIRTMMIILMSDFLYSSRHSFFVICFWL